MIIVVGLVVLVVFVIGNGLLYEHMFLTLSGKTVDGIIVLVNFTILLVTFFLWREIFIMWTAYTVIFTTMFVA